VENIQDERLRVLYDNQPVEALYIVILALRYRGKPALKRK
jgi:hypothetical protein